jgi:hypothetical protein
MTPEEKRAKAAVLADVKVQTDKMEAFLVQQPKFLSEMLSE